MILQQVNQLLEECISDQNYSVNSFEEDGTQTIAIAVYHSRDRKISEVQHFKNQLEEKFTEFTFDIKYNPENTQIKVSIDI